MLNNNTKNLKTQINYYYKTISIILLFFLLFVCVGVFEPSTHYTKQEQQQIENIYKMEKGE